MRTTIISIIWPVGRCHRQDVVGGICVGYSSSWRAMFQALRRTMSEGAAGAPPPAAELSEAPSDAAIRHSRRVDLETAKANPCYYHEYLQLVSSSSL